MILLRYRRSQLIRPTSVSSSSFDPPLVDSREVRVLNKGPVWVQLTFWEMSWMYKGSSFFTDTHKELVWSITIPPSNPTNCISTPKNLRRPSEILETNIKRWADHQIRDGEVRAENSDQLNVHIKKFIINLKSFRDYWERWLFSLQHHDTVHIMWRVHRHLQSILIVRLDQPLVDGNLRALQPRCHTSFLPKCKINLTIRRSLNQKLIKVSPHKPIISRHSANDVHHRNKQTTTFASEQHVVAPMHTMEQTMCVVENSYERISNLTRWWQRIAETVTDGIRSCRRALVTIRAGVARWLLTFDNGQAKAHLEPTRSALPGIKQVCEPILAKCHSGRFSMARSTASTRPNIANKLSKTVGIAHCGGDQQHEQQTQTLRHHTNNSGQTTHLRSNSYGLLIESCAGWTNVLPPRCATYEVRNWRSSFNFIKPFQWDVRLLISHHDRMNATA